MQALLIGKALLETHEVKNIPIAYIKHFHFNYGTAHLLKENYAEAKHHFKECLVSEPSPLLKAFTLNNMAVASWLHKYPYIREFLSDDEDEIENVEKLIEDHDYPAEKIEEDFQNVIPLFKRSIKTLESTLEENANEAKRNYLDHLLDERLVIPENIKKIVREC